MKSPLDTTPALNASLVVAVPADLKRRVFEAALAKGVSASHFARQAIAAATAEAA